MVDKLAPKKKQTRKGAAIPEHHRRNLELLLHSLHQKLTTLASIAFMMIITIVLIYLEAIKGGQPTIEAIFTFSTFTALVMLVFVGMVQLRRAISAVVKEIGIKKTAEKYKIPVPEARRFMLGWTDVVIITLTFAVMFVYLMWVFY